ncbi:MAG TPA: SpoIIE family protein phosphatase [Candidatus Sumerlaeota bacterium]|nr:SpoIIE family protein phosphatase [Candidatus Sumerlaeota bacterium]
MTIRLLVVDDEPDLELLIRQRFRRQIKENEYAFLFAGNGIEALDIIQKNNDIDIVLTDINMPDMDGLTLLLKLNEMNLLLKSVIVSAYGDMENIRTAMNRGAFDFLTKPIDFQDLDITIQKTHRLIYELKKAEHEYKQLEAIQRELDIARDIQLSILPRKFPPFPARNDLDIHAVMIPARQVGGDYYDFFFIDPEHLAFVIADVSGKGVPASLFMMFTRTLLKAQAITEIDPGKCLNKVNDMLVEDNSESMFVTLFYAMLNTNTGEVAFCNAGHNPPFIVRKSGELQAISCCENIPLGIFPERCYQNKTLNLEPGDGIFLYTDGITEAQTQKSEFFTTTRLIQSLQRLNNQSASGIIEGVIEDVRAFTHGDPQSDDITALFVRYQP